MGTVVGIPAEIKDGERRVALDPVAVGMLTDANAKVLVQAGAGRGAGFPDLDYKSAGAYLTDDPAEVWSADLIVKVKEPEAPEFVHFRPDLTIFAFLHLAAVPVLADALLSSKVTAYAFETVTERSTLPLLAPMSEVAGRAAPIMGAFYLSDGSGTLLGGASGVPPARVVIIGLGVAGTLAARGSRGLDAEVIGIDIDRDRLRSAKASGIVDRTVISSSETVGEVVADADLVIGAALVPGDRAPTVVTKDQVSSMPDGSVIVDLAIDQGGCIETSRPTTLSSPTFEEVGVVHYCVTNVPGRYPRTASKALSAALAPRVLQFVSDGDASVLAGGLNAANGQLIHPAVARALDGTNGSMTAGSSPLPFKQDGRNAGTP